MQLQEETLRRTICVRVAAWLMIPLHPGIAFGLSGPACRTGPALSVRVLSVDDHSHQRALGQSDTGAMLTLNNVRQTRFWDIAIIAAACLLGPGGLAMAWDALPWADDGPDSYTPFYLADFVFIAGLVACLLRRRGWRLRDVMPDQLTVTAAAVGLALAAGMVMADALWCIVARPYLPPMMRTTYASGIWEVAANLIFGIVRTSFGECFLCAYIIAAIKDLGCSVWLGVTTSIAIRLAMSLIPDVTHGILMVPLFAASAIFYCRTRRLWPILIASGSLETFAIAMLSFPEP